MTESQKITMRVMLKYIPLLIGILLFSYAVTEWEIDSIEDNYKNQFNDIYDYIDKHKEQDGFILIETHISNLKYVKEEYLIYFEFNNK